MVPASLQSDREAFRLLFEERRDEIFRFLYRLTRHPHDAEDLLQDTFARYWRKREQFRNEGSLAGYLRQIAYRCFLNARPRLERGRAPASIGETEPTDPRHGPADRATRRDSREFLVARIRNAVDGLPDEWREPFVLFRFEGLTCAQVADAMGITVKAVEMRVGRALRAVAAQVADLKSEYDAATKGQGTA